MKFKCLCCGECCRKISDGDDSAGLPLFEWEVDKIRQLGDEKINIEPIDCVLDKKSGLHFCTGYVLKDEPCVFLKDNKCSIHKDRPIICRAFPVAKSPEFIDEVPNMACFSNCPNFDFKAFLSDSLGLVEGNSFSLTKEKIVEEYSKTFDEEIMNSAATRDNALEYIDGLIASLSKEGLIDIEVSDKKNVKTISFFEFLIKRGIIDEKERDEIIKKLI
jgi:Fe-S-cluster containining protein